MDGITRSGSIPTGDLIRLCFSGQYTLEELLKLNKGKGGLIDLLGKSMNSGTGEVPLMTSCCVKIRPTQ